MKPLSVFKQTVIIFSLIKLQLWILFLLVLISRSAAPVGARVHLVASP